LILPDFVETSYWLVGPDRARGLMESKPGAVMHCTADGLRWVEIDQDRTMYDFIAGQISEE